MCRAINHRIYLLLSIFYLLFSVVCFAQEASKEEKDELFVAKDAFEEGFYDTSLKLFNGFVGKFPLSPLAAEANLHIGQCYFYRKEYPKAIAHFTTLLPLQGAKSIQDALFFWIAEAYFKTNDFARAYDFYDKLLSQYPQSSYALSALYSLAWCLFEQGKYLESEERFREFKSKYPMDALRENAEVKIIECFYNLKSYAKLKEYIEQQMAPDAPRNFTNDKKKASFLKFYLAESCFYLGEYPCAIDNYTQALEESVDSSFTNLIYVGLGWSYLKSNELIKAKASFDALKVSQSDEKTLEYALLGEALLFQMNSEFIQSLDAYKNLLTRAKSPQVRFDAYVGKAEALYALGNYSQAAAEYKEAAQYAVGESNSSQMSRLHYGLGLSYYMDNRLEEAALEFSSLAEGVTDENLKISSLAKVAEVYEKSGNAQKAASIYQELLRKYPDCQRCVFFKQSLGVSFLNLKRYQESEDVFKSLLTRYPHSEVSEEAYFYLGKTYYEEGDFTGSYLHFKEFASKYPQGALRMQALLWEGLSLKSLGRFQDAYDIFKAVLTSGAQARTLAHAEFEMADCLYYLQHKDDALKKLELLRSKYSDAEITGIILFRPAEHYFEEHKLSLSRRYLSELVNSKPNAPLLFDAYYMLGICFVKEEKYIEAKDAFKKISGDKGRYYPKIGDSYRDVGKFEEALVYYRESLREEGVDIPQLKFRIAECLEGSGRLREAAQGYLDIGEDKVLMVKGLLRCGKIYENQENWQAAIGVYERISSLEMEESKFARERIEIIKEKYFSRNKKGQ